jgi:colicin import membrane protein
MTARYPGAFLLSIVLHGLFAAALLYTAYALKDETIKPTKIFELVAGEGDNYAATEAPALGVEGGVRFNPLPLPSAPTPPALEPVAPAPPEPSPVQAVAPPKTEPKPTPKVTPKADTKVPDFTRNINRVENRLAAKQKAQRDKEAKAAELAARKAEQLAQQKAGAGQSKIAKIDAEGIAKGVIGGSTANKTGGAGGTALSRDEQDILGSYMALLKQHLSQAHEKPPGLSDNLSAQAECYVAANGVISKARITRSSGNSEFDQSVLAAFSNVRTIGPRPDGEGGLFTFKFRMKDED